MPSRRFPYLLPDVPTLNVRVQAKGHDFVYLNGIVDSGATTTALSRKNAEQLGLTPGDLIEAPPARVADGSETPCWSTLVPIRARVYSQSVPDGPLEPWGPIIDLKPVFLDRGEPLWGHHDFFANFKITFDYEVAPPWFELKFRFRGRPRL